MLRQIKGFVGNVPVGLIATVLVAILIPSLLVTGLGLLAVQQADSFVREQSRERALDRLRHLRVEVDREWSRRLAHLAFLLEDASARRDRLGELRDDPWVRDVVVEEKGRLALVPRVSPYRLLRGAWDDPGVAAVRALEVAGRGAEEIRRAWLDLYAAASRPATELEALLGAARASAPTAPIAAAGYLEEAVQRFGRTVDETGMPRDIALLVWKLEILAAAPDASSAREATVRELLDALAKSDGHVDPSFLLVSRERARRAAQSEWDSLLATTPALAAHSGEVGPEDLIELRAAIDRSIRTERGPEGFEIRKLSFPLDSESVVLVWRSGDADFAVYLWLDTEELLREVDLVRGDLEITPASLVLAHNGEDDSARSRRRAVAEMAVPRPLGELEWLFVPAGPPPGFRSFEIFTLASFSWAVVVLALTILVGTFIVLRAVLREMRTAKMKSDFVSFITHELKTPLAAIRMFSETLSSKRYEDEEEMRMCLRMIDRESERLGNLIDRVLEYSRIQSKQKKLALASSSMLEVVEEAVRLFNEYHKNEPREIEVNAVQHISKIRMDRASMVELVLNLLSNANKYSPRDKKIQINLRETVDEITVEVIDRGFGIRKRDQRRVFERFFRAEDYLTRDIEGYGLGLAFARYIARQHKGDIRVSSQVNSGSTFTLFLRKEDVLAE